MIQQTAAGYEGFLVTWRKISPLDGAPFQNVNQTLQNLLSAGGTNQRLPAVYVRVQQYHQLSAVSHCGRKPESDVAVPQKIVNRNGAIDVI
jgi:hypothetical protein